MTPSVELREPLAPELHQLARIPTAAQFLNHRFLVVVNAGQLAAFLAFRAVAEDEFEILQLETLAPFRRRGFARQLLQTFLRQIHGSVFLEVRESNAPARHLYSNERFTEIARRRKYYPDSQEDAIVLQFRSC